MDLEWQPSTPSSLTPIFPVFSSDVTHNLGWTDVPEVALVASRGQYWAVVDLYRVNRSSLEALRLPPSSSRRPAVCVCVDTHTPVCACVSSDSHCFKNPRPDLFTVMRMRKVQNVSHHIFDTDVSRFTSRSQGPFLFLFLRCARLCCCKVTHHCASRRTTCAA